MLKSSRNKPLRAEKPISQLTENETRSQLQTKQGLLNQRSLFASSSNGPPDPLETRLVNSIQQLQARLNEFDPVDKVTLGVEQTTISPRRISDSELQSPQALYSRRDSKMQRMPAEASADLQEKAVKIDQAGKRSTNDLSRFPPREAYDSLSAVAQAARIQTFMNHLPTDSDEEEWDEDDEDDDDNTSEYGFNQGPSHGQEPMVISAAPSESGRSSVDGMDAMDLDQVIVVDVARTAEKSNLVPPRVNRS